ncbi:hypothetical protein BJ878DRAFT_539043 [Calycina marina]|uniref:Uncharacterized protein n=1 Tax=Calycina marina TaxID=1763456 RepID=A0A9P8CHV1_9HELO|nr:hypothetical protein BJ878DRAFT_539043 [Calycina marina]
MVHACQQAILRTKYDPDGICWPDDPSTTDALSYGGDLDEFGKCQSNISTACGITLKPSEPSTTTFIIHPNPTTITITTSSDNLPVTVTPEVTPPIYCYLGTLTPEYPHSSSTSQVFIGTPTVTVIASTVPAISISPPVTTIVTQKQPVTVFTNGASINCPSGPATVKQTVTGQSFKPWPPPPANTRPGPVDTPELSGTPGGDTSGGSGTMPGEGSESSPGSGDSGSGGSSRSPTGNGKSSTGGGSNGGSGSGSTSGGSSGVNLIAGGTLQIPITTEVGGVTVVISPTKVIIGTSTVVNEASPPAMQITVGQQTFTVNPSQVIGPVATIALPANNAGAVFMLTPVPTVISGVPEQIGPDVAIIGGSAFAIGPGAPHTSIVINGQTVSIGPGGLDFASTMIAPPSEPTHIVILGDTFSALGASPAVIGG